MAVPSLLIASQDLLLQLELLPVRYARECSSHRQRPHAAFTRQPAPPHRRARFRHGLSQSTQRTLYREAILQRSRPTTAATAATAAVQHGLSAQLSQLWSPATAADHLTTHQYHESPPTSGLEPSLPERSNPRSTLTC